MNDHNDTDIACSYGKHACLASHAYSVMQTSTDELREILASHGIKFRDVLSSSLLWALSYVFILSIMYLFHSPFRVHNDCRTDWYAQITKILQIWCAVVILCFHVGPHFLHDVMTLNSASAASKLDPINTIAIVFVPMLSASTMTFLYLHKVKRRYDLGITYGSSLAVILLNSIVLALFATAHYASCIFFVTHDSESGGPSEMAMPSASLQEEAILSASPTTPWSRFAMSHILDALDTTRLLVCPAPLREHLFGTIVHLYVISVMFICVDYHYKKLRSFDPSRGILWGDWYDIQKDRYRNYKETLSRRCEAWYTCSPPISPHRHAGAVRHGSADASLGMNTSRSSHTRRSPRIEPLGGMYGGAGGQGEESSSVSLSHTSIDFRKLEPPPRPFRQTRAIHFTRGDVTAADSSCADGAHSSSRSRSRSRSRISDPIDFTSTPSSLPHLHQAHVPQEVATAVMTEDSLSLNSPSLWRATGHASQRLCDTVEGDTLVPAHETASVPNVVHSARCRCPCCGKPPRGSLSTSMEATTPVQAACSPRAKVPPPPPQPTHTSTPLYHMYNKSAFTLSAHELRVMKETQHPVNRPGMVPWFSTFIANTTWQSLARVALEFLTFDVRGLLGVTKPKIFHLHFYTNLSTALRAAAAASQTQTARASRKSSRRKNKCSAMSRMSCREGGVNIRRGFNEEDDHHNDNSKEDNAYDDDASHKRVMTLHRGAAVRLQPSGPIPSQHQHEHKIHPYSPSSPPPCDNNNNNNNNDRTTPDDDDDETGAPDVWFDWIADIGDGFNSTYELARLISAPVLQVPVSATVPILHGCDDTRAGGSSPSPPRTVAHSCDFHRRRATPSRPRQSRTRTEDSAMLPAQGRCRRRGGGDGGRDVCAATTRVSCNSGEVDRMQTADSQSSSAAKQDQAIVRAKEKANANNDNSAIQHDEAQVNEEADNGKTEDEAEHILAHTDSTHADSTSRTETEAQTHTLQATAGRRRKARCTAARCSCLTPATALPDPVDWQMQGWDEPCDASRVSVSLDCSIDTTTTTTKSRQQSERRSSRARVPASEEGETASLAKATEMTTSVPCAHAKRSSRAKASSAVSSATATTAVGDAPKCSSELQQTVVIRTGHSESVRPHKAQTRVCTNTDPSSTVQKKRRAGSEVNAGNHDSRNKSGRQHITRSHKRKKNRTSGSVPSIESHVWRALRSLGQYYHAHHSDRHGDHSAASASFSVYNSLLHRFDYAARHRRDSGGSHHRHNSSAGYVTLPRGSFVVVGGDLAYPNPTDTTYSMRLFKPYNDALSSHTQMQCLLHAMRHHVMTVPKKSPSHGHVQTWPYKLCSSSSSSSSDSSSSSSDDNDNNISENDMTECAGSNLCALRGIRDNRRKHARSVALCEDDDVAHIHMLDAVSVAAITSNVEPRRASRGSVEEALFTIPMLFAIPGNHDWFDGLSTFRKFIIEKTWMGGRFMPQRSSYFVLKLPFNWFMLCGDTGQTQDIDVAQRNYFLQVIEHYMDERSCVILASHEPGWIYDSRPGQTQFVQPQLKRVAHALGTRLRLWIAGDLHNYSRHIPCDPLSDAPTLVVSGGGGAFMHGVWGYKVIAHGLHYVRAAAFPHRNTYMSIASRLFGFRLINWKFDLIVGCMCFLVILSMLPLPFTLPPSSAAAPPASSSASSWLGAHASTTPRSSSSPSFSSSSPRTSYTYSTVPVHPSVHTASQFMWAWIELTVELVHHLFAKGVVSPMAVLLFFVSFASTGESNHLPLWWHGLYGSVWTITVVMMCCGMLAYLWCLLSYMSTNGMLESRAGRWSSPMEREVGRNGEAVVAHVVALLGEGQVLARGLRAGQRWLQDSLLVRVCAVLLRSLDPIEAMAYLSARVSSGTMGRSAEGATRTVQALYYVHVLSFYWILVTPLVSFIIGSFLFATVSLFHYMFDAAYSAFQIEDYKHFIRFKVCRRTRELHAFVLAERVVPKMWELDPNHVKQWQNTNDFAVPPHLQQHPSRWRPRRHTHGTIALAAHTADPDRHRAQAHTHRDRPRRRRKGETPNGIHITTSGATTVTDGLHLLEHFVCRPHRGASTRRRDIKRAKR